MLPNEYPPYSISKWKIFRTQPRHLNLVVMDRIPFTASGICERFNRIFSAFICCLFCIFFIFLLLSGFLCYFCKHIVDAVFFFSSFLLDLFWWTGPQIQSERRARFTLNRATENHVLDDYFDEYKTAHFPIWLHSTQNLCVCPPECRGPETSECIWQINKLVAQTI